MGDDIGLGSACFDFRATNVVHLSIIAATRSTAYLVTDLKTLLIREGLQFLQSELPVIE